MTSLELVLSGVSVVLSVLVGLLVKAYLPAYAKEKAKNLATKEDIADITAQAEKVRAEISKESALLEKRREVYERITNSLRVFISGHASTEDVKEKFHAAYSACWLWAPDAIIENLTKFIKMQQAVVTDPKSYSQGEIKRVCGEIILGMRKDVGFPSTKMDAARYSFVQFGRKA